MFGPLRRSRLGPQNVCASRLSRKYLQPDPFQSIFRHNSTSPVGQIISSIGETDDVSIPRKGSSALQEGKKPDLPQTSKGAVPEEAPLSFSLSLKQKDKNTEVKSTYNREADGQNNFLVEEAAKNLNIDNDKISESETQKSSPNNKPEKKKWSGKTPVTRDTPRNGNGTSAKKATDNEMSSKISLDAKAGTSPHSGAKSAKNAHQGRSIKEKLPITYIISKEKPGSKLLISPQPITLAEVETSGRRQLSGSRGTIGVDLSSRQVFMSALRNNKLGIKDKKIIMAHLRDVIGSSQSRKSVLRKKNAGTAKSKEDAKNVKNGSTTPKLDNSAEQIKQKPGMTAYEIKTIDAADLKLVALEKPQPPVPSLAYGLERVLFNPGVYHLRDPRSRVFNFDPYLQSIMPVAEFDFNALKEYITSSRDETLISTAAEEQKKYTGSTSSMTSALAHFHFLLSQWRPVNISSLSQGFPEVLRSFTSLQRAPSAVFLRWKNGTYAIDADKEFDTANILMMLGKSMEKLLTLPTKEFERYRKENSSQITADERNEAESFHYTTMGDFLMRSQLDAYDQRIPGTGMFDLKTRAVVSIRMDAKNYQNGLGYEIRSRHGEFESYEREYYDMIRAAFLKYSLQVRMGRMDGIFVAFHNTERIFGFQYISLPEMDFALHGQDDLSIGDSEFKLSLELLNRVLDRATTRFPEQSLRIFFETRESTPPFMYIFAEPVTDDEIDQIQNSKKAEIEEYERKVLRIHQEKTPEEIENERGKTEWEKLQAKVEDSMDEDELEVLDDRELILNTEGDEERTYSDESIFQSLKQDQRAVQENILALEDVDRELNDLETRNELMVPVKQDLTQDTSESPDERSTISGNGSEPADVREDLIDGPEAAQTEHLPKPAGEKEQSGHQSKKEGQLLAMTLTIRNKVNGAYVERPEKLSPNDRWSVEYALAEVPKQDQSRSLYEKTQRRRARALQVDKDENSSKFQQAYAKKLRNLSMQGRKWREEQNELDQSEPYKILKSQGAAAEEKDVG